MWGHGVMVGSGPAPKEARGRGQRDGSAGLTGPGELSGCRAVPSPGAGWQRLPEEVPGLGGPTRGARSPSSGPVPDCEIETNCFPPPSLRFPAAEMKVGSGEV